MDKHLTKLFVEWMKRAKIEWFAGNRYANHVLEESMKKAFMKGYELGKEDGSYYLPTYPD